MTLIELVRRARELGFSWIAIEANGKPWFYDSEPHINNISVHKTWCFSGSSCMPIKGEYNLTCDWRKAIIEVDKITEKGE